VPGVPPTAPHARPHLPIFDLDGTLVDSDAPLAAAFVALGVPASEVTWGHVIAEECERLGISLDAYLAAYDTTAAQPFPGVTELVSGLRRWGVCSNKHPASGRAELARLGWEPDVALFADAFAGPKRLEPVLDALGCAPAEALFVGDTAHDLACAEGAGVRFAWAGWNPRSTPGGPAPVLTHPGEVLDLLAGPVG
jgi:HAD superfamily hydrolase (TIGR01549 family)